MSGCLLPQPGSKQPAIPRNPVRWPPARRQVMVAVSGVSLYQRKAHFGTTGW
jgi:hypothetical protein